VEGMITFRLCYEQLTWCKWWWTTKIHQLQPKRVACTFASNFCQSSRHQWP
jgi:hypothetical protein